MLIIPERDAAMYADPQMFRQRVYEKLWHVHIKKTFRGAGQVISYLGKYTHRVAISNNRLLSLCNNVVQSRWKDYRDNRLKIMQLDVLCFIRRFLQHILPCGYYKIRYYGIFAAVRSKTSMAQCFSLLAAAPGISQYDGLPMPEILTLITGHDVVRCPQCREGTMISVRRQYEVRRRYLTIIKQVVH